MCFVMESIVNGVWHQTIRHLFEEGAQHSELMTGKIFLTQRKSCKVEDPYSNNHFPNPKTYFMTSNHTHATQVMKSI